MNLLQLSLPKWPQMIVTGIPVTEDQAKDIIFKTDDFLSDFDDYAGGNNRTFTKLYQDAAGISEIVKEYSKSFSSSLKRYSELCEYNDSIREKLGFIKTEYVHNDWASSCFAFGPHGWMNPDGNILFNDNVGKWPSVEDIYNEWKMIAEAFTFLEIAVTLMSGERSEENTNPIVSFIISNGKVSIEDGNLELHKNHYIPSKESRRLCLTEFRELGLKLNWYIDYAIKIRDLLGLTVDQIAIDQMTEYFYAFRQ